MSNFNEIEQEVIILSAVWEMVDDMVNLEIFQHPPTPSDAQLTFRTATHMRLFNVLLGDFLSRLNVENRKALPFNLPRPNQGARATDQTYLFYLRQVCVSHEFGDAYGILGVVNDFSDWLEETVTIENVCFSELQIKEDITVMRTVFLKLCSNIGKHNFLRLSHNANLLVELLRDNGHEISTNDAYLVLPEFYEWFHSNIFAYHASTISEFLNNLRHEIYSYLRPEFDRSYQDVPPPPRYRFDTPATIKQPTAKVMYWNLMNMVRRGPIMPRFRVNAFLKKRY